MTTVTTKAMAKVAAVATGLAMATSMLSLAPMAHAAACTFSADLTIGSKGDAVTCLQQALIAGGFNIPAGATGYFGSQTKAAVSAWQKANGVTPTAGYFGAKSRAAWNLSGSTSTGTGTTGTTGTTVGTGTGLKIMLSPTSPNGTVLVAGQGIGDLGDFVFANPTSAPISVKAVTFNRIGVSNDQTLANVYLYSGMTRITDSAGVSNSAFTFSDPTALFTVPAGGTYTVSVRSDIALSTSGQQIGVKLVNAAATPLDSSVNYPISSGLQTISAATLATVQYQAVTPAVNTTVNISAQNDYPVWQDTVSVSQNPVKLTSLRFTNLGSADSSSVTNVRLYVDGVQVGTALSALASDRSATFDLSAAPVMLSTQSHTIKVLANITNSAASRTILFSVQRSSDAMFVDSMLGQPVTPTLAAGGSGSVSAGTVSVQAAAAGSVSVTKDPSSPSNSVAVGATNVNWASFDFLASGENTKVMDLYVYADTSVSNGGLKNGKIMVNGVQVGSNKDIVEGNGASVAYGSATDYSLGSSLILPAGQTTVVSIYADAKTTASVNLQNNETVTIYLAAGSSNAQGTVSYASASVPNTSNVGGNSVTVTNSSLTATKYSGYGNQSVIAGAQNAKIGAFTLSTGSTEGVTVNTINVNFVNSSVSSTITNLTLKDDATGNVLGTVITTPSQSNSFAVNIDVPASATKTIDVYANVLSSANAGTIVAKVGANTTGTGDTTGTAATITSDVQLQTISLGQGSLTVARGAGDPVANNVLAGASSVMVGEFNFAAQTSAYTVQNLAVLVPNNAATSVTNVTVSYKDVNGVTQTATQSLAINSALPYATATFTGLTMYVPVNDSSNVDIYVGTPTIASGATSGTGIKVLLDAGSLTGTTFKAVDSSGAQMTQVNGGTDIASNGTFYVRKSIPTFAMVSTGNTVPATGSPLYKFTISADPAGAVEWTKLVFNIATSGSTATTLTNVYLTDDASGNSLLDSGVYATTNSTTATVNLLNNATQPNYQQVAAGSQKTYDLYGTVAGYTTGSTITISLASDGAPVANAAANAVSTPNGVVWSDRSASAHATSTADWTNGYLLKNFTSNAVSYSK